MQLIGFAMRHQANTLRLCIYLFSLLMLPLSAQANQYGKLAHEFTNPKLVEIIGNPYSAMEAFITRDGKYLFFNSEKNDTPNTNKNIYYAKRINNWQFKFIGEIKGINTDKVDGVPTMDSLGNFYYVSTSRYGRQSRFNTVYSGKFYQGRIRNIKPHPELSLGVPGWLNMDIEISADGKTLYATQTFFGALPPPKKSYFFIAHKTGDRFVVDKNSRNIFKNINSNDLEYGASISTDELEIFFTRLSFRNRPIFTSYRTTRPNKFAPFSKPVLIKAITGFAEAPAITNDGRLLYFHKKNGKRFYLYVLER